MNELILGESFIGGQTVKLDQARYNDLLKAKSAIRAIWDLEEVFSLLANAYIDLEEFLLRIGLEDAVGKELQRDHLGFFDDVRQRTNLKLITLLTTARMYQDQSASQARVLSSLTGEAFEWDDFFSEAFDQSLEYRVMHALRNHALHRKLPLGIITLSSSVTSAKEEFSLSQPRRIRMTFDPCISVPDFTASDKIREKTRTEVQELNCEALDLKFFMRGFIGKLASCHEQIRKATQDTLHACLATLDGAKQDLSEAKQSEVKHLAILKRQNGQTIEEHPIDPNHLSRICDLRKLWTGLKGVQSVYVSSEIKRKDGTYPSTHPDLWIPK